ncbi:hypothetical protein L873DRAFT_1848784 [Choiromyces venosus 120613-1]|uniref:Uncharacterized protein n=1 Tax=Choiromyces venosus 120613-1 TaxID=1336337 RepID=A0A3N4IW62_9PEZI|nr:hypothetical protein L873DRAFT_1848784 [Choiromyces venosus 120613-1]
MSTTNSPSKTRDPPGTTPRKRQSLQHIMDIDQPRPARRRLGVLAEIENDGVGEKGGRRKSDFEVYKDRDQGGGGGGSPTSLARFHARLENEKWAEVGQGGVQDGQKEEDGQEEGETTVTGTSKGDRFQDGNAYYLSSVPYRNPSKPSISELLLGHSQPKPDMLPLPTPPLSLLNRRQHQQQQKSAPVPAIIPEPVMPKLKPESGPSPLQQMRLLRAQLEATRPPPPLPPAAPLPTQNSRPNGTSTRPRASSKPASTAFSQKYTFTLRHLPQLTHHSKSAIISVHPPTHIHLQLRNLQELRGGGQYSYTIPSSSLPITVRNTTTANQQTFEIEDLPLKHLHAVRYAKRFVDALKKRTVIAKVEVRSGGVWTGRMFGDGKFEVIDPAGKIAGGVVGSRVKGPRRVVRMYEACQKILQDSDDIGIGRGDEESGGEDGGLGVGEFRIDKRTDFVTGVGWCRRDEDGKGWRMMFLDGVRLEIEGSSGDVLWVEGDQRKVLKRGMEVANVRERVMMFVEKGL